MEPSQDHFNKHFLEMAEGKVMDGELSALARGGGLGGHRSNPIKYKMSFDTNSKDPRPIQNVTSQVASYVNQAKSRLGEAIKLGENETGISPAANHSTRRTSTKKRKKSKDSKVTKRDKKDKKKKSSSSKKSSKNKKKKSKKDDKTEKQ